MTDNMGQQGAHIAALLGSNMGQQQGIPWGNYRPVRAWPVFKPRAVRQNRKVKRG